MIKNLLAAAVLILTFSISYSQNCIPDGQYTTNGIHPDSATNFAPAYAGTPYSQLITVIIPQDTTVFPFPPIPWDSTVMVSMTGLPPGFTYACWNNGTSPSRCSWRGNTTGCCIIAGNPTINDTGTYNLTVQTNNYVGGSTNPIGYTITYYKIRVNGPANVPFISGVSFSVSQNTPNPANNQTGFDFISDENTNVSFKLYNIVGAIIYSSDIKAKQGTNHYYLDTKNFSDGIYLCSFSKGDETITKRMVVSH